MADPAFSRDAVLAAATLLERVHDRILALGERACPGFFDHSDGSYPDETAAFAEPFCYISNGRGGGIDVPAAWLWMDEAEVEAAIRAEVSRG